MRHPNPGDRFFDRDTQRVVTFLGDHGHGPWWQPEIGEPFTCDWLDYYLCGRFEELR